MLPTITTTPNIVTCPSSTYEMDILIWDFAIEEALHKFVLAHPMPPFLGCL